MRLVAADSWLAEVAQARADGFAFFDWLGAEDQIGRSDTLRVMLALRRLDRPGVVALLGVELPRAEPRLASIRAVFAGAAWHEREAAELFGVEFMGGEPGRLLLAPGFVGTPLRKDEVLAARTALGWPGAKEPGESGDPGRGPGEGGRRRLVPPGVPDPAVWGDRDASSADPDPAEVAGSAEGGRTRRRRP
jgi:NADH-quinone oxidoreductase subunit C